jgi:hypothetical protein
MKPFFPLSASLRVLAVLLAAAACERSIDDLSEPKLGANPNVFIDGFSASLNYAAFGGSVPTAFQVDRQTTYNNSLMSMRIDVPNVNDPRGAYAGGTFFTSVPRDLSGYDALTFWAKASQAVTIDVFGLGNDLGANRYLASVNALPLSTAWTKVIIPLPDPARLNAEKGMFYYSTGPVDGKGYTFWIDEVKFEKLGTVAHPKHEIMNGANETVTSFTTVTSTVTGLRSTFSLPTGGDFSVGVSPAYFVFASSNEAVATVNAQGVVTAGAAGTADITATLGGVAAIGKLTVTSRGAFNRAPVPADSAHRVISLFSNAYTNRTVDYYNGYWAPYQTTQSADFTVEGDAVLNYTNFNFVGIQFSNTINLTAAGMTHLRLDIYLPNALATGAQFKVQLVDFGADGVFGGTDNSSHTLTFTSTSSTPLRGQQWVSFNIPLVSFVNLRARTNIGQLIFEGTNITNFYADNIYFRR